jgi:diaminopimelate decarboxylase
MATLLSTGDVTSEIVSTAAHRFGTPLYLYDASVIAAKCDEVLSMPNEFGLKVRYAMKANSSMALLQFITGNGLHLDLSSLNEGRRAHSAGIPYTRMMLTTQEIPVGSDRYDLEKMLLTGMKYNVCSLRQLDLIADFVEKRSLPLSMRVHPGIGSGESATRNTGDKYSCFGIHLSDLDRALDKAEDAGLVFDQVHTHIGSGGDPSKWRDNISRVLEFAESCFPDATTVSMGGGLKEARMPGQTAFDVHEMGLYAQKRFADFYARTGRKLTMEIEPGTFIVAQSGYIVTEIQDIKRTGSDGFEFLVLNGGMEVNTRPLLYGSEHPFYVVSKSGELLSSEFDLTNLDAKHDTRIPVGRCCESGDSQSLDDHGHIVPRVMASAHIGDYVVIGGCGAYCASMSPFNYNSQLQAPETLLIDSELRLIREKQTLKAMIANERPLS